MSEQFPSEWLQLHLGDTVEYGKALKTKADEIEDDTWVLELEDIEKHTSVILQRIIFKDRQTKSTKNKFKKGDVLYGKLRPYLNKVVVAEDDGVCSTEILPLSGNTGLNSKYLFYWLKHPTFLEYVTKVGYGVNMPRLGTKDGKQAPFIYAPLAEQKEIATQLDDLLAQVDTLKNRLDAISTHLKHFRQSVLAAAVNGKLTEDWRVDQKQKSQDLDQIKKHWELEHIKNNKKYRKPKIRAKNTIHDNVLPSTWLKTQIGYVFDVHIGSTPKRSNPEFWEGDIHWVSSSEVAFCTIENTKENITELGLKSSSTRVHPIGTVMLAMIGQGKTRGQAAILGVEACHNQNTAALRVSPKHTESKFLYYYLVKQYEETRQIGGGNNQKALNKSTVISLNFPLPPLEEQAEIVTQIETLFAFADKIESRLKQAQEQANNLTPSLLAKAFRGDLTAEWRKQNPDLITGENSAEALLARIKAEQEKLKPKRKTRKKKA